MTRYLFTIEPHHIGKSWIKVGTHGYSVSGFLGRVLPGDIGKRVFRVNGILQVENDQQRDARLAASGS
jgi:hypothetical protein